MKRIRNSIKKINLRYIVGEVLLIFIGISLAIWFNNWNSSMQSSKNKKIVMVKIKEEIAANLEELLNARKVNELTRNGYSEYQKLFGASSNEVIATPSVFNVLQKKYPSFFQVKDSVRINQDTFMYSGGASINLELGELTDIAWKAAQSINITNEFDYECLYELESTYNLQARVKNGFDQAANALIDNDIKKLIRILNIIKQLDILLEKDYRERLAKIEECR